MEVKFIEFLTSVAAILKSCVGSASGKRVPVSHWIKGRVGPKDWIQNKNCASARNRNLMCRVSGLPSFENVVSEDDIVIIDAPTQGQIGFCFSLVFKSLCVRQNTFDG